MQVSIHEKSMSLNDDQKTYVIDKVDNLKHLGERIDDESTQVRVDVELNKVKTSNRNITVQVTMFVPHAVVRAEVYGVTVEEAIDVAVDKLRKQLERYKSKKNRRDKSGKWIPVSTLEQISSASEVGAEVVAVSKRKTFELEPMHEEEAIEQLELLGHGFYAFLNSESDRINVVYRRDDGSYGLLDFTQRQE